MKKFIAAVMSLAIAVSATAVLAANSSPTHGGGSKGSTTVHEVTKPGTPTAAPTEAPAETTAVETAAPAETTAPIVVIRPSSSPSPVTDNEIVVVEVETGENPNYTDSTDKIAELNKDGYTDYGTYDVTTDSEEYKKILKESGTQVVVTIDADLYGDIPFITLVNYGDEWIELDTSKVKVNGDGTVTVTLDGLGEVKFLVDKQATPVPTVAPVTPAATAQPAATPAPTQATATDKPSKEADYTVDKHVDYTVVSPQTGYLESWEVACNIPAALK